MLDELVRDGRAAVQVGHESDAQARRAPRAVRDAEHGSRQLDVVALVEKTVRAVPVAAPTATAASPAQDLAPRQASRPPAKKAYVIIWATSHHFHLR